jgi:GNAT superfamily N-acetyltransferase
MNEEIKISEQLTEAEIERLFRWGDDVFDAAGFNITNRAPELHFVLECDGLAMSHLSIVRAEVTVGRQTLHVGGVGGVVTRGDAQGQGYAGQLLRFALEYFEREWHADAGMLFCFQSRVPYYAKQEWQLLESPVFVEQPTGQIEYPARSMVFPLGATIWPMGTVQVTGLPW